MNTRRFNFDAVDCRFNDIELEVRQMCVKSSQAIIVHHPELTGDLIGVLSLPLPSKLRTN